MYFKEYILPLWYFSFSAIFLLFCIYSFLYRILVARRLHDKRRIEERDFRYLYSFISGLIIITSSLQNRNNINTFLAIILIGLAFYLYDYNFILKEGLFIKGKFISWNRVNNFDYKKNNKEVVLSYFKDNNHGKASRVTFTIRYDSRLVLENIMMDKLSSTNVDNGENEDKVYSAKPINIALSLALIFFTLICIYGVYNLLKPRVLGEVLEKNFNHRETPTVAIRYEGENKDKGARFDMSMTSKEDKIQEIMSYLKSFELRKIRFQDIRYSANTEYPYSITLYELDGNKVEISISKKEHILEIRRDNKKRSYFVEEGYDNLKFLNKLGKAIE